MRELSVSLLILCFFNVSFMFLQNEKIERKCFSKKMIDDNLKQLCKKAHGKAKFVKGQKTLTFSTTQEEPPKKGKR